WFGPGRHAKVVSTKAPDRNSDGLAYRDEPLLTGDESRVAEVRGVEFPRLLDPVDDLPPVTVVTHVRRTGSRWLGRGTTSDNGTVKRVVVNGREARSVRANFAEWEAVLDELPREGTLSAHAEDAAGNVEKLAHVLTAGGTR